jgi:glycine betaine/choline ABC-type transport system substrate-binding protein
MMRLKPVLVLLTLGLLAGCEQPVDPLQVGSKDFVESQIVGHMLAALARDAGIPIERKIPFGTSAEVFEAVKQGKLDLYLDYTGTALAYTGQAPLQDGDASFARVKELYSPLGLVWLDRLGFADNYGLVMRPEAAEAHDVENISDLGRIPGLVMAVDSTFAERPLDGLPALVRRYALTVEEPLVHELGKGGKDQIVQALLDGKAQVAELFTTDPEIDAYGLKLLNDDLRFFPVYEAAPVARQDALARFPKLAATIGKLAGAISTEEMRGLNADVTLGGQSPESVALAFLAGKGLLQAPAEDAPATSDALRLALEPEDSLSGPAGRAVRAARTAFDANPLQLARTAAPLEAVASGQARIGITSADAFFTARDGQPQRREDVEALGVVGYKLLHLVVQQDGPRSLEDIRRLGVGPAGTASDRTARLILAGLGLENRIELVQAADESLAARAAALRGGEVDGLLIMAPQGDQDVALVLEGENRRLLGFEAWAQSPAALRFSFLRPARIAAGTYPNMPEAVDTLTAQMVLIGPGRREGQIGERGPQTTGTETASALPDAMITRLREAFGRMELVDPALPQAAILAPQLKERDTSIAADPWASLVNFLVTLLIAGLFYLLVAEPRVRFRQHAVRG